MLPCYSVLFLLCYLVTLFPNFYSVTLLLCSLVTPLPSYLVTLNSYHVTLLPLLTFLPTSYPFRRLLRTLPRARYGVPSDPLSFGWPATQARLGKAVTGGSIDEIDLSHSEMRGFKGTDSAFVSEWLVQPGLQKLFTIYKGIK